MTRYLPIMLDCEGQHCVVIGGGVVAERKVSGLLEAGAVVKVISPSLTDSLDSLAEKGLLIWMDRTYAPGDLRGAAFSYMQPLTIGRLMKRLRGSLDGLEFM